MLEFTGERFLPQVKGEIAVEHYHRYLLAAQLAKGRTVLDIACGEGYGSSLLAKLAASVTGVDIDRLAVQHASEKYKSSNLDFVQGDCTAIPLPSSSFEVIISFETIEHHDRHDDMIRELKRLLTPNGLLIISSPDKLNYSDIPKQLNPHHVKELYKEEFVSLLSGHFQFTELSAQRIIYGSAIFPETLVGTSRFYRLESSNFKESAKLTDPMFWIALASNVPVPALDQGICELPFSESDSVSYKNAEITRLNDLLSQVRDNSNRQIEYRDALAQDLQTLLAAEKKNAEEQITYRNSLIQLNKVEGEARIRSLEQTLQDHQNRLGALMEKNDVLALELHHAQNQLRSRKALLKQIIRSTFGKPYTPNS